MDTGTSWGEPGSEAGGSSAWGSAALGQQPPSKPGECSGGADAWVRPSLLLKCSLLRSCRHQGLNLCKTAGVEMRCH